MFPINFQINTLEQLEIVICALSELKDSDEETQWQCDCLRIRLETIRKEILEQEINPANLK